MPLKYAYHPGNVAHSSATEVAETMEPVAQSLGIELVPMRGATSCGAGIIRQASRRLQLTLNARTFAMAEELGLDIITPCAATAGNLQEDLSTLKQNPNLLAEVNEAGDRVLRGHLLVEGTRVHGPGADRVLRAIAESAL